MVGLSLIAHYYNSSANRNNGKVDVVYTCKQNSEGMWAEDLERGVMPGIRPYPWQTDTSIGDWYYNRTWKYRGADWVIHMLVDIVSKNGNLLINVVQRPDGSLDAEPEQILADMADWIAINGEAIYETRPWLIHGEGPVRAKGGHFKEDFAYTAKDLRFTSKGENTLYAFVMGWPAESKLVIRSLSKLPGVTGKINAVELLGHSGQLTWTHDSDGLSINLPEQKPCKYAVALKISGENLRGFKPELATPAAMLIQPDSSGTLALTADEADLKGSLIKVEEKDGQSNIGFWDKPDESASWKVNFKQPGKYKVTASVAAVSGDALAVIEVAGCTVELKPSATGSWEKFSEAEAGTIEVPQAGVQTVKVRSRDPQSWKAINLRLGEAWPCRLLIRQFGLEVRRGSPHPAHPFRGPGWTVGLPPGSGLETLPQLGPPSGKCSTRPGQWSASEGPGTAAWRRVAGASPQYAAKLRLTHVFFPLGFIAPAGEARPSGSGRPSVARRPARGYRHHLS